MQKQIPKQLFEWTTIWNRLPIFLFILATTLSLFLYSILPHDLALLALVAPIGAAIGILFVVRPQILLVITIAYFPLENGDWFDAIVPSGLSIPKVLGALLLAIFLFNIFVRKHRFRFFDDALDFAVVLFCIAIFISSILSPVPEQVIGEMDRILRLVAFYVAIKNLVDNPRTMYLILLGLFITSVYATGAGFHEYLTTTTTWGYRVRVSGINENPNNFALFSVIAIAIGLHLAQLKQHSFWLRIAFGLAVAFLVAGVVMSASRGGMISTAIVFTFFIWKLKHRVLIVTVGVVALILSFPFWPEHTRERLVPSSSDFQSTYQESAANSSERRTAYINFGTELIVRSPIIGNGYRSFSQLFSQSEFIFYDNPMDEHDLYRVAHNVYLETITGTGIFGLIAFISMLGLAWRAARRSGNLLEEGSVEWAAARAVEYGLLAYCFSSIFISSEQFKQLWYLLGMASAVYAYTQYNQSNHTESEPSPSYSIHGYHPREDAKSVN